MALFVVLTLLPLAILTYAAITLSRNAVMREVRARVQISATLEAAARGLKAPSTEVPRSTSQSPTRTHDTASRPPGQMTS
jgi:hypothetical protein